MRLSPSHRVGARFVTLSATVALAASIALAPVSAQASVRARTASGWTPVVMPTNPPFLVPTNIIAFGADGAGNIYYLPAGAYCQQLMARSAGPRAHLATSRYSMGGYASGCGVIRYDPATGALSQLDGGHNFSGAADLVVDPAGNVFVLGGSRTIYEISSSGVESTFSSAYTFAGGSSIAVGLAVDAQDHVFVTVVNYTTNPESSSVQEVAAPGATPITLASSASHAFVSIAVAPDGTLYTVAYDNFLVYRIPAGGGTPVSVGTGWSDPSTVAVDAQGNVYVADPGNGRVTELTSAGQQLDLPTVPVPVAGTSQPTQIFSGDGVVYLWDAAGATNTLYAYATSAPRLLASADATAALVEGHETQTVTATWTGARYPSYVCTLLYGFNDPSTFTVRTSQTTCSFGGLALKTAWGVQIVGMSGSSTSPPVVAFAPPARYTVTCVGHGRVVRRTGTDPVCPPGWRQRP